MNDTAYNKDFIYLINSFALQSDVNRYFMKTFGTRGSGPRTIAIQHGIQFPLRYPSAPMISEERKRELQAMSLDA